MIREVTIRSHLLRSACSSQAQLYERDSRYVRRIHNTKRDSDQSESTYDDEQRNGNPQYPCYTAQLSFIQIHIGSVVRQTHKFVRF